jgi:hypothetical protein
MDTLVYYVEEHLLSFVDNLFYHHLWNKYDSTLQRLITKYDMFDLFENNQDRFIQLIHDEFREMNIKEYTSSIDFVNLPWGDFVECMEKEEDKDDFINNLIRKDNFMSKLIRLTRELAKKNIVMLNNVFTGGSTFCAYSKEIFEMFPNCKGVIGWCDHNFEGYAHSVSFLCHEVNDPPQNGNPDFIKKEVYPIAEKLNLVCQEWSLYPTFYAH